eukprot:PhF_6_TR9449/c0_g1_i3/m.14766
MLTLCLVGFLFLSSYSNSQEVPTTPTTQPPTVTETTPSTAGDLASGPVIVRSSSSSSSSAGSPPVSGGGDTPGGAEISQAQADAEHQEMEKRKTEEEKARMEEAFQAAVKERKDRLAVHAEQQKKDMMDVPDVTADPNSSTSADSSSGSLLILAVGVAIPFILYTVMRLSKTPL